MVIKFRVDNLRNLTGEAIFSDTPQALPEGHTWETAGNMVDKPVDWQSSEGTFNSAKYSWDDVGKVIVIT